MEEVIVLGSVKVDGVGRETPSSRFWQATEVDTTTRRVLDDQKPSLLKGEEDLKREPPRVLMDTDPWWPDIYFTMLLVEPIIVVRTHEICVLFERRDRTCRGCTKSGTDRGAGGSTGNWVGKGQGGYAVRKRTKSWERIRQETQTLWRVDEV